MEAQPFERLAILASPPPPLSEGEVLTSDQWTTLFAICDAFIPALDSSATQSTGALGLSSSEYAKLAADLAKQAAISQDASETVRQYLSESVSSIPAAKEIMHRMLGDYSRPAARSSTAVILSVLG